MGEPPTVHGRRLSWAAAQRPSRRKWFDQGHAAFERNLPTPAKRVPFAPFYVCPICLGAYSEAHLADKLLTREDVPPASVGGSKIVLTCKGCNSTGGHDLDHHARREADVINFYAGQLTDEIKARLRTPSGDVPIRLTNSAAGLLMIGVPDATNPDEQRRVTEGFDAVAAAPSHRTTHSKSTSRAIPRSALT